MHATTFVSLSVFTTWIVIVVVTRRNRAFSRKVKSHEAAYVELVRRLSLSHLAAVRLLSECSSEEARRVSPDFARRRAELVMMVAAVGEFSEDRASTDDI